MDAATAMVSAVLSLRHFRLARWCVLYPLAGGADDSDAAHSTGSGRRLAASPVLFREIVVFFLVLHRALPDLQRMKLLLVCGRVVGTEVGIPLVRYKPDF